MNKQTWQGVYQYRCTGWSMSGGSYDYIVIELPDGRSVEVPVTPALVAELTPRPVTR